MLHIKMKEAVVQPIDCALYAILIYSLQKHLLI